MILVQKITDNNLLQYAWQIRKVVFLQEQNCPEEIEWEFEEESTHYLALYNGLHAGTARWRQTANGIKLERFAVLNAYRHKGVGAALLTEILKEVIIFNKPIYLHAQLPAKNFYLKHGFIASGNHFFEADIEHVKMIYH